MAKKALCVGINTYPTAPLNGCVNDARDWELLLRDQGYQTQILLNSQATRLDVLEAFRFMVRSARFGDRLVFTYSGHGTWVPDLHGDEPDGRDEALAMYNFATDGLHGLILDDELEDAVKLKRFGVRVTIISDSCHSGSVSRLAMFSEVPIGYSKPRYVSPVEFLDGEALRRTRVLMRRDADVVQPRTSGAAVLMSGCADAEFSYDAWIDNRYRGAFTAAATKAFGSGATPPNYGTWHKRVRALLPTGDYPQTPQMYASPWQRRWSL